jgi:hypothetical protein
MRSPMHPARSQRTKTKRMRVEGGNSHWHAEFSRRCLSLNFRSTVVTRRFARGSARKSLWWKISHRRNDWASRSLY